MNTSGETVARDEGGSMTTTLEAPVEPTRIERVEDVPEEVRKEIVELRAAGSTLAELKGKFPALTPDALRGVLPPMNKREATTRSKSKTAGEAEKTAKPVGGKAKVEKTAEPKPAPEPRYATDLGDVPDRVVAARKALGRKVLAEALSLSESATWRAEQGRVHPGELKALTDALGKVEERIAAGEFAKPKRQPTAKALSKADLLAQREQLTHLVTTAREAKSVGTIHELLDRAVAIPTVTDDKS
jgi:ribosome-binding protein aMBF1 (putative translation factor)